MAEYGISTLSIIPGRNEPADAAEQVTQLLFGEFYQVKEARKTWIRILTVYDNYECWIDRKQHYPISDKYAQRLLKQKFIPVSLEVVGLLTQVDSRSIIPIMTGSSLPFFKDGECNIDGVKYRFDGQALLKADKKNHLALINHAELYLNTPYLWGGRHPFGIDCSGFTQICYKMIGVAIPRDAYQQAELGHSLSFIEEAQPGDLAFFDNPEGKITHVGLMLENNRIIHASGKVRIDRIDHQGIYNDELNDYSHRLRIIKRVL